MPKTNLKSIAETTLDGEGEFSNLIYVTDLKDGTCLVYETQKVFGIGGGVARITRLDSEDGKELCRAHTFYSTTFYSTGKKEKEIIRKLNDMLFY